MRYIVVDLEATCWEKMGRKDRDRQEIIEIGAVALASSEGPIVSEFDAFVHPVVHPQLSDYCLALTSIRQEDVNEAEEFWAVFPRFLDWIGSEPFALCSWGAYDLHQLETDCARHNWPFPETFRRHINLKREFARIRGGEPQGMAAALASANLTLEGTHHRGIDDARNAARLALLILPTLEAEQSAAPAAIL